MGNQIVILALIQALTQEVNLLQQELAQLQASSTVAMATVGNIGAPDLSSIVLPSASNTPPVEPVPQTITQTMPQEEQTISVTFATSTNSEALVTVKNTLGVAVRIKNLDVDGTLAGFTIGTEYGQGFVYPQSFKDTQGKTFDVFTCEGLGSLGSANMGSSGMIDPCLRRDARLAKNELQPEETMILRYTGNPTEITYQPGSITDLQGNDVQF